MERGRNRIARSEVENEKLKQAYEEIRQILAADERERHKRDINEITKTHKGLEADVIHMNQESVELRSQNDLIDALRQEFETVRKERGTFAKNSQDFRVAHREIREEVNENQQGNVDEMIALADCSGPSDAPTVDAPSRKLSLAVNRLL